MTKIEKFKKQLARVFDGDLNTVQWGNVVDYVIIGLIVVSTLVVFISTFEVSPLCERVLHIIDMITVVTFTIEVAGGKGPYTYQWQFAQGNNGWKDADGSWSIGYDSNTFSFTVGEDEFYVGYEYRCVITDAFGRTVATNTVVVLPK